MAVRFPLIIVALWLVSPALHASQIEAFSANISSLAIHFGPSAPGIVFPDMPGLGEYIYFTRVGVIMLIRIIGQLTGHYGSDAFLGLMVVSFATFFLASAAVARRFAETGTAVAVAAVLLIPGAVNSSFFFNDNIPSAAFATLGLALVSWHRSLAAYAAAGALLGFAIMCRIDAVFVAPMIAGVCWIDLRRSGPILTRAAVSIASAGAVIALVYLVSGVTPLDALRVGPKFLIVTSKAFVLRTQPELIAELLGLPGIILLVLGVAAGWTRRHAGARDLPWLMVFLIYPLFAIIVFPMRTSLQVRHFYPLLVPFLAVHIAAGLGTFRDWIKTGDRRPRAFAILGVCALVTVLPPSAPNWIGQPTLYFKLHDGPRSLLFGRLWMPLYWLRWQYATRSSMASAKAVVAQTGTSASTLILTSHYDDEAYLKLAFLEAGYSIAAAGDVFPDCRRSAVLLYTKPGHSVFLVRSDNQYRMMPLTVLQAQAFFVNLSLTCTEAWRSDRALLTMMGRPDRLKALSMAQTLGIFAPVNGRIGPPEALSATVAPAQLPLFANPFTIRTPAPDTPNTKLVPVLHAVVLRPEELTAIADRAASETKGLNFDYERFRATYRSVASPGEPHQ